MEDDRRKDDPMDLDQPEHVLSSYTTPLGSPSYSPPLEEHSKEERDDNDDEDEDEETEKDRAARRKAKGKAKASPPPEEHDSDDEHQMESPRVGSLNPATLDPIAEEDNDADTEMDMDMDSYWARQAREAYEIAARADMSGYGHEKQFGEADAAMNDALYSHPSSPSLSPSNDNDKENQKAGPGAPNNSPERGTPGASDHATVTRTFAELQQQQLGGGGRGRGRGRGSGGGWTWQETMTQEKVEKEGWGMAEKEGWGAYDTPPSSPLAEQQVLEESAWEAYDEAAWEAAAERAAKQETPKVTLKLPHSTLSVKPSNVKEKGEGSTKHKVGPEQSGELVRAVRSYKAIFSATYLSYEKDDVMRVLHRDKDGKLCTLLPLKDRAFSGKAHTNNFVTISPPASGVSSEESGAGRSERKGG